MLEKKIGFLGGGAMAEAMLKGLVQSGVKAANLFVCDHKKARCEFLEKRYGVHASVDRNAMLEKKDVVVLAVKPQVFPQAAEEARPLLEEETIVLSLLAGIRLAALEEEFPNRAVLRVMPNTPLAVGEGMSAIAAGKKCRQSDVETAKALLEAGGKVVVIEEKLMDAVTGLSGSGPAFAFVLIDALADAGVDAGLKRADAILLAAQTLLGAAKMVLETDLHPAQLRDLVTSPAGTTIAGIKVMERRGVRGAMMEAVEAAVNKSKAMGKS